MVKVNPLTRPGHEGMLVASHSLAKGSFMKPWKLAGSTALVALVAANAALAEVTPEEVWQNWQDFYASSGSTITTGSAERDGDTLVVTDFKAAVDTPANKSETTIAEIRLRDLGDGSVEVTMSEEAALSSTSPAIDGAPANGASGVIKMPGLVGTVSGTAEEMAYAFTAPSMEVLLEPTEDGAPVGKVGVLLSDIATTYQLTGPAEAKLMDGSFEAASAAINLEVKDDTSTLVGSLNTADVSGEMTGNFAGIEEQEAANAFAKGFALDMSLAFGALNYDFDITDESGPAKLTGGSEGGSFQVAMDAARMLFAGGGKNVTATFSGAQLPFPEVKLSYAESGFNLTMPLSKAETPQDFSFLAKIIDLQVSDEIWGMFDPTGALPHDPATIVIDTAGKALLKSDLMTSAEGAPPDAELHALEVKDLQARIAGAELTGRGAFTFDNTDLTTYEGVPAPTGKIDLKLVGGNTLLDKLVAMGLVAEEQAMGARMMIAMFANPGAGADELTSVLEFKDKSFYANGQQLQ